MGKVAVGATVYVVRRRMKSSGKWGRVIEILKVFEEDCATPIGKLRHVADAMTVEMHAGLASEGGSKLKLVTYFPQNSSQNLSGIHGSYTLFSSTTGQTLASMDGTVLTLYRTSSVSGLGSKILAREGVCLWITTLHRTCL